jgi:hypothetical protein
VTHSCSRPGTPCETSARRAASPAPGMAAFSKPERVLSPEAPPRRPAHKHARCASLLHPAERSGLPGSTHHGGSTTAATLRHHEPCSWRPLSSLALRMGTSVEMIDRTYGQLAPDAEEYERGLLDAYDAKTEAFGQLSSSPGARRKSDRGRPLPGPPSRPLRRGRRSGPRGGRLPGQAAEARAVPLGRPRLSARCEDNPRHRPRPSTKRVRQPWPGRARSSAARARRLPDLRGKDARACPRVAARPSLVVLS